MRIPNIFKSAIILICVLSAAQYGNSQIRLPQLVSDSMILQRNTPLNIWGWASSGEKVSVIFNGKKVAVEADKNGNWKMTLPAMKAGGPYEMVLKGKNTIRLNQILIGDVWLCSGQSNMVHQMRLHNVTYKEDIKNANYPEIRQFWIPTATSLAGPQDDTPKSSWKWANPTNVNEFSAVAYFFARNIYERHHVPIGIINSSVGGTPIEAWTSEMGLKEFPQLQSVITRNKDTSFVNQRNRLPIASRPPANQHPDKGMTEKIKWFDTDYEPKGWRNINIPGYWEDQGIRDLDGVVWFRKEIEIPANLAGMEGLLFMGRIIDADIIYLNGKQIGSTSYMYPQRRYTIPSGLLKSGKNVMVVRVQNNGGKGGFVPDKPYYMEVAEQKVDLKGDWMYKVGQVMLPVKRAKPGTPGPISAQNQPTALYNAMIAPLINYNIKGTLWYQGESNVGNANEYQNLLQGIIKDWRTKFANPKLPFYYAQLPNFGDATYLPVESGWAILREATLKTLKVPHTGMAITIDLGEWNDIHPDNKKDVGERLALIARHFNYGEEKLVYSGPVYKSASVKNGKIIIDFEHAGSGLISIDGEDLSEIAIAGENKEFVWAKARIIDHNKIEVWSDEVPEPKYVRYAWADNPVNPNLYNKEGLPASPFRTGE